MPLNNFSSISMFVVLDIDECGASPVCDINANCSNTRGSYICTCRAGYTGDGKTCQGRMKGRVTVITTRRADSQGLVTTSKNRQSIESSPFIYRQWMRSCLGLYFCYKKLFEKPGGKQPTFGDATTGFPTKWCLRNRKKKFRKKEIPYW